MLLCGMTFYIIFAAYFASWRMAAFTELRGIEIKKAPPLMRKGLFRGGA